jgi:hypothetical protein
MSIGKEAGEFPLLSQGVTVSASPDGRVDGGGTIQVNYEGTADNFGVILGTLTFTVSEPGAESGTTKWVSTVYLENFDILSAIGSGVFNAAGDHTWRTRGMTSVSAGTVLLVEGVVSLADRFYKGKLCAWE